MVVFGHFLPLLDDGGDGCQCQLASGCNSSVQGHLSVPVSDRLAVSLYGRLPTDGWPTVSVIGRYHSADLQSISAPFPLGDQPHGMPIFGSIGTFPVAPCFGVTLPDR